jgi:hypothetical protein
MLTFLGTFSLFICVEECLNYTLRVFLYFLVESRDFYEELGDIPIFILGCGKSSLEMIGSSRPLIDSELSPSLFCLLFIMFIFKPLN